MAQEKKGASQQIPRMDILAFCQFLKAELKLRVFEKGTQFGQNTGHTLGIWICGRSLFYRRELLASKSMGATSSTSLKICGCKRQCPKDLWVCAPAAPMLTNSLKYTIKLNKI